MSRCFGFLLLFLVVSCSPPPPMYVEPTRDASTAAADVWAADLETVADTIGIGRILFQDDPQKKTGVEYCNDGNRLTDQGEFRLALRAKSKALYLASRDGDQMLVAHCAAGIALIYDYVGDNVRSVKWANYAQDYLSRAVVRHGDIRPAYIRTMILKVQADAAWSERRYSEAQDKMRQAMEAAKENPRLIPWVRIGLANLLADDDPDHAVALLNQSIAEDPGAYQFIARRILGSIELRRRPDHASTIFAGLADDARARGDDYTLSWAERGSARAAIRLGQPLIALAHYQQAVDTSERVRRAFLTEEFRTSTFGSLLDIFDEAIILNMQNNRVVEAFEIAEQSRARSLRDMMRDTSQRTARSGQVAAHIQAELPPDTTMISYYMLSDRTYVWKIGQGRIIGSVVPVESSVLADATLRLHGLLGLRPIGSQENQARAAGLNTSSRSLWRYLINPLNLPNDNKLIVIPHRFLHFVPMGILRDTGIKVGNHAVSYAPSGAAWLQANSRVRRATTLLAFGNPDTAATQTDLKGAVDEVLGINRVIPKSDIAIGRDASRDLFMRAASRYDILHFAAHARSDYTDVGISALMLAGSTPRAGWLEARDIYRTALPNASLVTMSACETALGELSVGDEVYSLTSAFLAAGAKNVITTLWAVSDLVAAKLMEHLYRHVASGMDYAEALQQAQLAIASDPNTADPYFWAGFELVGAGSR